MPTGLLKSLAVTALALAAFAGLRPARAQGVLPPGPGRDLTAKLCSDCHGLDLLQGIRRDRTLWETTMVNMMNAGMKVSDADFETVVTYLSTYLGPQAAP